MDADRPEFLQLWNLVTEITEQLNQNKAMITKLQTHVKQLKEQAGNSLESGPLRRFNTDVSKEAFTTEIERLSVALIMENQTLLHENKQLSTLLQEYEVTMENVMSKFRNHAYAAQTHQATLVKHYETLLSEELGTGSLESSEIDPAQFQALQSLIEQALRCMEGKDPALDNGDSKEEDEEDKDEGVFDWAEEREIEIERLEKENAELRKILGISAEQEKNLGLDDTETELVRHIRRHSRSSSFRSANRRGTRSLSANIQRKEIGMQ